MSFRAKLVISVTLLVAFTFGIGGTMLISSSFDTSLEQKKATAFQSYESVRNTLYLISCYNDSAGGEETVLKKMSDALQKMEQQEISYWQVLSLEDSTDIIYKSGDIKLLSGELPTPGTGKCASILLKDESGSNIQMSSIIMAGDRIMVLKARYDLSSVYAARETEQRLFVIIYICVVVFGVVLVVFISFMLTRKLKKLTATAKRIAGGELSYRSDIKADDEFGQLSETFNNMADKLQENINRLEEDVQRQESFMGAFAHELKTPMTSIIGYADLLRQGGLEENDRISAANYIFSEGKRLEKLSFKLLDLMLLEKDQPEMRKISLASMLTYVSNTLSPVMKKKNIKLVCRSERSKVYLEPDLIKSLLYNLIDNASKAIKSGGVIAITGKALDGGCQIQVVDNGQGMEEAELSRITEAFYRVDKSRSRQQGGAGLGLALCKKIVELHNGTIRFSSIPGKGTCVSVELFGKGGSETDENS